MAEQRPGSLEQGGARILVIDDEEVVHLSLRRILGRHGHQVDTELDAARGLQRLVDASYELIITDLMMPGLDGIQLLQALRARGSSVPVLMITGYPTIRTAIQALRLGAVDYVAKPFTQKELMAPVRRALQRSADPPDADESAPATAPDADGIEGPKTQLAVGDRCCLPAHAWAVYEQDGTLRIGIAATFLRQVGEIESLRLPSKDDLVEQGRVGIWIITPSGDEHGVYMPLSGVVVEVNAVAQPDAVRADLWLVRLVPDNLDRELPVLVQAG